MLDQILQNTADKIEVDIYFNNVLTIPTNIVIRQIIDPNGVVILTDVTPTEGTTTGRYSYTVPTVNTAILGIYTAIWRFTIDSATYEHTQYFEVVSSIRTGYTTPYEVRQKSIYDKITATDPTDDILQRYIDRATVIIDTFLGGSINYAIYSEQRRCVLDKIHNGVHIQLANRPIISLTSVILDQGPTNTISLDVDYIRINNNSGYLEYFSDISMPSLRVCTFDPTASQVIPVATVVYTAGYVTIPDAVKQAAIIMVEELYKETNGDDKQLQRFKIDAIEEVYSNSKAEEDAITQLGLKNARTIIKLLRPYRQTYRNFPFVGPLG
jgi:hypothetical protein